MLEIALEVDHDKLRMARKNRSLAAVAKSIGMTRQGLWQIETGRCKPSSDTLAKLCFLYGVEISDVTKPTAA